MKRLLMIAYHFPPLAGSSGVQRTLRLVQHLPRFGWEPLVLTVHPRAYERTDDELLAAIPPGTVVRRAFALDTSRQLAFRGRYVGALARPDRWVSWRFGAVREGLSMIRDFQPELIWSTFPIATAHLIGAELQRRSGLPWFADFRDPMAQDGYPADPLVWKSYKAIEERALKSAALNIFTTPGAAQHYRERYRTIDPDIAKRIAVLENGYDEQAVTQAAVPADSLTPLNRGALTLLHSGIVYPAERDPAPLFEALARLRQAGALRPQTFRLRFRAAVHEDLLRELAARHGVEALVEILPPVGYREALREMLCADALLVLQGASCNWQIPAKVYEYLRAGRPILGLTDPAGDTAAVLRAAGIGGSVALESAAGIAAALPPFLEAVRAGSAPLAEEQAVRAASREARAETLAMWMDRAVTRSLN
jgi:glycosyltransferase involved in cell wall biosynthesis